MSVERSDNRLTAAKEILLAARDLDVAGRAEFTEWDLTVAAWRRNSNRFGCRGYEGMYPDHKRVMMEIMGITKKDNPLRRGWIEKTRPNYYQITDLGRSEADTLGSRQAGGRATMRSPQPIYDAVSPLYHHPVFRKFCQDPEEPRMWLGAASFLGLKSADPQHVEDRQTGVRSAIENALNWLDEIDADSFRSGVSGGQQAISRDDLRKLLDLLDTIETRFGRQFEAIQKRRPA